LSGRPAASLAWPGQRGIFKQRGSLEFLILVSFFAFVGTMFAPFGFPKGANSWKNQ